MKEWEDKLIGKIDDLLNSIVSGERVRHPYTSQLDLMILYLMMRIKQGDNHIVAGREEALSQLLQELKEFQKEQEESFARLSQINGQKEPPSGKEAK